VVELLNSLWYPSENCSGVIAANQRRFVLKIFLVALGSFLFALGLMLTDELFLSMSLAYGNSILTTQYDYPFLGEMGVWQAWEIDFGVLVFAFLLTLFGAVLPTGAPEGSNKVGTRSMQISRRNKLVVTGIVIAAIILVGTIIYTYSDISLNSVEIYIATKVVSKDGNLLGSGVQLAGSDTNVRLLGQGSKFSYTWVQQPISVGSYCSSYTLSIVSVNVRTPGFVLLYTSPTLPATIDNTQPNTISFQIQLPSHAYSGVLTIYLNETATCN
jgi:hypothetical protein